MFQDGTGLAYGLVTFGEDDDGELICQRYLDGVIYSVSAPEMRYRFNGRSADAQNCPGW